VFYESYCDTVNIPNVNSVISLAVGINYHLLHMNFMHTHAVLFFECLYVRDSVEIFL